MSNYWTLHVKDFAKIREAKIEAAPLTLFVGDNNSGKSYLLSLLWGLTGGITFPYLGAMPQYQKSQRVLDSWLALDSPKEIIVGDMEYRILIDDYNMLLNSYKESLMDSIFNSKEVPIGWINVDSSYKNDCQVSFRHTKQHLSCNMERDMQMSSMSLLENNVVSMLPAFSRMFLGRDNVFIPAPRTGFLLTFKTLAQKSIRSTFSSEPKSGDSLTGPQVSYLERLTSLKRKNDIKGREEETGNPMKVSTPRKILDFVEQHIISGKIDITDTPLPEIQYKADSLNQTLPLYLSSGVVAEVAGFLSLLKFGQFGQICIYEEPEMCLHPDLQWKMARVLVKLVNAGFTVWASTHSDIIIQHVNNMIKLSNHPDGEQLRKDHDYDEDDVISREKVRMYQFDVNPADYKTDVKPLEDGVNGFRIPTFGKVFRKLRDESWDFQIETEELKS